MDYFIDMHCHCLPGIDDGAKTMEESLQMLQTAYADGIRKVIVTPHFHHRRGNVPKEVIFRKLTEVQEEMNKIYPDFELYPGNELYYSNGLPELLAEDRVCTMASSRYVLIEFSPDKEFAEMRSALLNVQAQGVWPILAHIERYLCLVNKPRLAEELAEMGIYLQVNADGVLGKYGRKEKKLIKKMFSYDLISFVATDAHDTEFRKQELAAAAAYVRKKFGDEIVDKCFRYNQQMVIENKII